MEPIINPVWIYLIDIASSLNTVIIILTFIFGIIAIIIGGMYLCGQFYRDDEDDVKAIFNGKRCALFAIILAIIAVAIPSKKTLEKMIVAKNVTYDRVEIAAETIQHVYDDIINIVSDKDSE